MASLYLTTSTHPDPVIADRAWLNSAIGKTLCPECNSIDRRRYPAPVNVVLRELPEDKTSGLVAETGVSVTRVDFLDELRDSLRDFVFGRCVWQSAEPVATHVTAYGPRYLALRGGKEDHYYSCRTCGTLNTYYSRVGKYVLQKDVKGGLAYETQCGRWILTKDIAGRIDWARWPDMELTEIPILDKPREGDACPLPA